MRYNSAVALAQPGGRDIGPQAAKWLYLGLRTQGLWLISDIYQIEGLLWQACAASFWSQG